MKRLRILVTAGPTREWIDPIRFISNRSSGKMGYAIARAAAKLGAVTLVSGPTALKPPAAVEFVPVTTADEMARAVFRRYPKMDVVIMTGAVCDFRPRRVAGKKIKKTTLAGKLTLELEATTDILAELARRKKGGRASRRAAAQQELRPPGTSASRQLLIGFAAETNDVEQYAADKLRRKNLDMIVANDTRAFDRDTNTVTFLFRDGRVERLPELSKRRVAGEILKRVRALLAR